MAVLRQDGAYILLQSGSKELLQADPATLTEGLADSLSLTEGLQAVSTPMPDSLVLTETLQIFVSDRRKVETSALKKFTASPTA